jgi:hypothetical protein
MEPLDRTLASDAERDAAAERLQVAFAEGRLADTEFDQRMRSALTARTSADLAGLLEDLPNGVPPARPGLVPAGGTRRPAGWRSASRARSARPGAGGSPSTTPR